MTEYLAELSGQSIESVIKSKRFELKAKVRHFSDESIHKPGEPHIFNYIENIDLNDDDYGTMFDLDPEDDYHDLCEKLCDVSLYLWPNGANDENKGYISLSLEVRLATARFSYAGRDEFSCTVSVIDSSGNKRFLRSFTFLVDPKRCINDDLDCKVFDVDRYIKRETLLSDPLDLLPGDYMSLYIEATLQGLVVKQHKSVLYKRADSIETVFVRDHSKYYLSLDSMVGERLKEECICLKNMSESGIKESTNGLLEIPRDETKHLFYVCQLLMGSKTLSVRCLSSICKIYRMSDKYDIPAAIEICRRLVISFLRVKNDKTLVEDVDECIPELLELAEEMGDKDLKEIVESFLKSRGAGSEDGERTEEDVQANLDSEWKVSVKYTERGKFIEFKAVSRDIETFEFDFYQ